MNGQLNLLPLVNQFDKEGFITDTTFFETDLCEAGYYHLVFNMNTYSLFIPDGKDDWLAEVVEAESVVITKGSYNGKNDCFEIMFEDNTETPFMIIISDEQFSRISPLEEGWNGHLYIFAGSLNNCKQKHENVHYRVADSLPFCKPIEKNKIKTA